MGAKIALIGVGLFCLATASNLNAQTIQEIRQLKKDRARTEQNLSASKPASETMMKSAPVQALLTPAQTQYMQKVFLAELDSIRKQNSIHKKPNTSRVLDSAAQAQLAWLEDAPDNANFHEWKKGSDIRLTPLALKNGFGAVLEAIDRIVLPTDDGVVDAKKLETWAIFLARSISAPGSAHRAIVLGEGAGWMGASIRAYRREILPGTQVFETVLEVGVLTATRPNPLPKKTS